MLRNDLYQPWFVGDKDWGVEIISGDYKGVSVQIEKLEFPNEESGELQLDFHVIHRPEFLNEDDLKSTSFNATIELIINDVLREALDGFEQTRNNDSKESDT